MRHGNSHFRPFLLWRAHLLFPQDLPFWRPHCSKLLKFSFGREKWFSHVWKRWQWFTDFYKPPIWTIFWGNWVWVGPWLWGCSLSLYDTSCDSIIWEDWAAIAHRWSSSDCKSAVSTKLRVWLGLWVFQLQESISSCYPLQRHLQREVFKSDSKKWSSKRFLIRVMWLLWLDGNCQAS